MNFSTRRLLVALLAATMLVTAGTAGVVAHANDGGTDDGETDEVRIIDEEILIADGTVTISDTTINAPGVEDKYIDKRKYTVEEATVSFDGFHVTFRGTEYTFCQIDITFEDVGVVLEDVHLT